MIREFQIECPECQGWILLDLDSGEVLKHGKKGETTGEQAPKKFDDAFARFKQKEDGADDLFGDAMQSVEEQKKRLGDAFEQAKKKASENPDEKPRRPFDDLFD